MRPSERVTREMIVDGLRRLGLDDSSSLIVHSSLRSFGHVDGGAEAVCQALLDVCGTVVVPASTWDVTSTGPPPGLLRPHNAIDVDAALSPERAWADFDARVSAASPFSPDTPIDREIGRIPETLRQAYAHERSVHPLCSYVAVGDHATRLVAAQRMDWPLGPIEELAALGGDVLLLGVSHTSNTTIHLAEQQLGRSRFYRYALHAPGVWMEVPNVPGESHRFSEIQAALSRYTRDERIGRCRVRRIAVADVLWCTDQAIRADPTALLCSDASCRCGAALRQRLIRLREEWTA